MLTEQCVYVIIASLRNLSLNPCHEQSVIPAEAGI